MGNCVSNTKGPQQKQEGPKEPGEKSMQKYRIKIRKLREQTNSTRNASSSISSQQMMNIRNKTISIDQYTTQLDYGKSLGETNQISTETMTSTQQKLQYQQSQLNQAQVSQKAKEQIINQQVKEIIQNKNVVLFDNIASSNIMIQRKKRRDSLKQTSSQSE